MSGRLLLWMRLWCDFHFALHYNNNLILSYSTDSHGTDQSEEDEGGRERKSVLHNWFLIRCEPQTRAGGCFCTSMVIFGGLMLNSSAARNVSLVLVSFSTTAKFTISSPARTDSYSEWGIVWWSVNTGDKVKDVERGRNEANQSGD